MIRPEHAPPRSAPSDDGQSVPSPAPLSSSTYLLARLASLEAQVQAAVDRRRAHDPDPHDPVRGLYVDDPQVDALLDGEGASLGIVPPSSDHIRQLEAEADAAETAGVDLRLRRLRRTFDLADADMNILLTALAPDLDRRYEWLYAYLHDDIARKRASIGLALELIGATTVDAGARERLAADGPLAAAGLLTIDDTDRPFLTRALTVPDRVTGFLLGGDRPDAAVTPLLTEPGPLAVGSCQRLTRALAAGAELVYVRDRSGGSGPGTGATGLGDAGWHVLQADLSRLPAGQEAMRIAALAAREAALAGAGLVAGPVEALDRTTLPTVIRALVDGPAPVVLTGGLTWEPAWTDSVPLQVEAPPISPPAREQLWADALDDAPTADPTRVVSQLRLTPRQIHRAGRSALLRATADDNEVQPHHLRAAVREQNASRLEHLARRIEPAASFDDIVLPDTVVASLREIIDRARHHHRVLHEWCMGGPGSHQRGITGLFAGPSGTGKTLSAEVVAHTLGLDLYTIDLSAVVDKYIGETEKNLDRIFEEAEGVNGVLFFDEADALFSKRSDVSDAHDRYANIETAFLLQRMEHFDGIAVLATNLRANLDEAFTRRLDVLIHFPEPDEAGRRRLWQLHLPAELPREEDLDLGHLARTFRVTGGDIRNITLAAAYAAADTGTLTTSHLVRATAREYRKLGRLVSQPDFGLYSQAAGDNYDGQESLP